MTEPSKPSAIEMLQASLDRLNGAKLADVYKDMGITPPEAEGPPSWERVEYAIERDDTLFARRVDGGELVTFAKGVQSAEGVPGTYVIDGRIEVEHNTRLRPYQARGRLSRPGTNEEIYRTEPVAFKSINEIGALICGASYEPLLPDTLSARAVTEAKRQHQAIMRAVRRDDVLTNGSTFLKHGFAIFEVCWRTKSPVVDSIEFREQSSVERWLFDERQSKWVGTEFRTGGLQSMNYVIPNGDSLAEARSMLINLHASGNNLEGVSPIRVITGLRKLKELILQAFGISYQKYAVPIAMILQEAQDTTAGILNEIGAAHSVAEVQTLIDRLQDLRSRVGAVLPVPYGFKVEYVNPTNDMPDPKPLLEYIDHMMALVFANEGALLGGQSFGSYAMASKSDEKFMRAAPAYADRIAVALTRLLHTGMRLNLGDEFDEIVELPRYTFRFNVTQDTSRYLADLVMTMNSMRPEWPDEVRRSAAASLGLPVNVLDDTGPDEPTVDAVTGEVTDLQTTALNGAQVTSMVDVVQQVAAGLLPKESAIRILMRAFNMGREDAQALVNPAADFEQSAPPSATPDAAAEIVEQVDEEE